MALFTKMREKIKIDNIKNEETDFTEIENQLIFGNLSEEIDNIMDLKKSDISVTQVQGENKVDIDADGKDLSHDVDDPVADENIPTVDSENVDLVAEVVSNIEAK